MKRRVIGTVLFGLGVALVVLAVGLRFYVAPIGTKIPYDLKPSTSVALAKNATFLLVSSNGLSIRNGDLQSTTYVVPQPVTTQDKMVGDLAGKAVVWDVYSQTVATSDQAVVDASSVEIALDRVSGAAVKWDGAWENSSDAPKGSETKTDFKGNSYKLPFGAEKKAYDFWDGTLGKTFPVEFKAVETVQGLEAYRYEQVLPLQQAPLDATTAAVLASTYGDGTGGKLMYSNTRTLWVEPVTGQFLDVREQRHVEFQAANGQKTTLLDADFRYDNATKTSTADGVTSNRTQIMLVSLYLPIASGLVGLLLIFLAVVALRRDPSRDGDRMADDRSPRHLVEV